MPRNIPGNGGSREPELREWANSKVGPATDSPCPINCLQQVRQLFPEASVRDVSLETRTFPASRPDDSTRMYLLYFRLKVRFASRDPLEVEAGSKEPRFPRNDD